MLPEALRSVEQSRLASVFEHSITWEDDVWKADPLDVPGVHAAARRKFEQILDAVGSTGAPSQQRILLFHGPSGAGKTHLVRALRNKWHRAHRCYFGYAQMTPDVASYSEYFLRRLVNSLEKPYDSESGPESALMRLSNNLVHRSGALTPGLRELLKESAVEGERLARIIVQLADELVASPRFRAHNLDVNIVRALLYLQRNDPRIDQRVRQFLYGRQINDLSSNLVAGLEAHEGQDRAFEIIECLGRLMKAVDDAALVFCIDQVEDLRFFENAEDRFQNAIRDLIQIANRVPSSIVMIACLDDFYGQTRPYLPQSYLDRVEKSGPVLLSDARTDDEARQIIIKRLEKGLADEGIGYAVPQVVDALGTGFFNELKGLSTRRLLEHAQKRWHEFLGETPFDAEAPQLSSGQEEAALSIKAMWDRHIQDRHIEIPSEEPELVTILTQALRIASEELGKSLDIEIAPVAGVDDLVGADVTVRLLGSLPQKSRIFICNRNNQGGGLKRQLEQILQIADGRDAFLVRASEFPLNAKSPATQLIRRVVNSGGRRVVVLPYEWERMINVQEFHARNHREAGFGEWLAAQQPLSGLPSVRDLLRLDQLFPKPSTSATASATSVVPIRRPAEPPTSGAAVPFAGAFAGLGGGGRPIPNDNAPVEEDRYQITGNLAHDTSYQLDDDDEEILDLAALPVLAETDADLAWSAAESILADPPAFDPHNLEAAAELDADSFLIGHLLGNESGIVPLSKAVLRRHAAVLGGSGSGKTTLALSVVEQLLMRGIPVVLIDRKGDLCSYANPDVWGDKPGEAAERSEQRNRLAASIDVAVYTPGRTSGRPINITLLPNGIAELPVHEQQLLANVSAAALGEMLHLRHSATHQRMSGILAVALRVLGSKSRNEVRLSDLIRLLEEDDEEVVELTQRMDPSGRARRDLMAQLDSLLHRNAALFDGHGESLRMDALLGIGQFARPNKTRLSIVYTGFLGDNENVLFWVSQFLSEALRFCQRNPNERLQAVIMFDEADLYIPAGSKPATKEPLESLLKRARSAGIGLMLATQSPGDLDYRSRDQITSWFIGRVREDTALKKLRAAFASESGLDPARVLPNQTVGEFHLIQEGKVKAMKSRRSLVSADQVPFDRIEQLARETRRQETQQLRLDLGDPSRR